MKKEKICTHNEGLHRSIPFVGKWNGVTLAHWVLYLMPKLATVSSSLGNFPFLYFLHTWHYSSLSPVPFTLCFLSFSAFLFIKISKNLKGRMGQERKRLEKKSYLCYDLWTSISKNMINYCPTICSSTRYSVIPFITPTQFSYNWKLKQYLNLSFFEG